MKNKKLLKHTLLLCLILTFSNCSKKDDDARSDCGCNGSSTSVITDETGFLIKKTESVPNLPEHNFSVYINIDDCSDCSHLFLICNDEILSQFENIPSFPGMQVKFSGEVKALCNPPIDIPERLYNQIILTQITSL